MAIKIVKVESSSKNKILGTICADTKAEVTDDITFVGGVTMDFGSMAYTVNGDVAILNSEGHWNWVGEGES